MIDFWWVFGVGTIAFLILSVGLIGSVLYSQKTKHRLEREKYVSLLESENRYRDLFDNVTDIVYIHSLDGRLIEINRTAQALTGFRSDEMSGKWLSELIPARYKKNLTEYLQLLTRKTAKASGVIPILHRNERRLIILEYRSSLIGQEGKLVAVRGIARDVTDQVTNARRLRRSERRASVLLQKSREMQENLQLLSRKILQMSEEQRRYISRELHDEVGQLLTALSMNLEMVRKTLPDAQGDLKRKIIDAQDITRMVLDQIHNFLLELRPRVLDELGLLPAIRNLAHTLQDKTAIHATVSGDPSIEHLGNEQKIVLFRVVQESLTNASKHSGAQNVQIELQRQENQVTLEIQDDGRGFQMSERSSGNVSGQHRLGLLGMEERVKLIGGNFEISSKVNHGTRVSIRIPIQTNGAGNGKDQGASG